MSDNDALQIWLQYKQSPDPHLRERLILTYAPLVKYVAGRLGTGLPAHVEEGDLVSYGLLGLMNAIERYDPSRDIKFETYAISRIKGAIIDELRSMDWVPRSVRSRAREIERAIAELETCQSSSSAATDVREIAVRESWNSSSVMPSLAAISSSVGARVRRDSRSAIARSMSRARARTERGTQSIERSSSMIEPLMRAIA